MSNRDALLKRISAAQFAAWENHLYLDTHPNDELALQNMMKYRKEANTLICEYEKKYGPLSVSDVYGDTRFAWVDSPWPWDPHREGNK